MPTQVDKTRCRLCSKWRHPFEMCGSSMRGHTCLDCLRWHFHALDVLGGSTPTGCQVCGATADSLKQVQANGDITIRLFCHPKDGIYQLLCTQCSEPYARKRKDIYGDTAYAKEINL